MEDFGYLRDGDVYLDSACQSLRPQPVIDALNRYYTEHNSCGERVKYAWGRKTDELVEDTRAAILKYLKLKSKDYSVSFTLNTTYGINLLLQQFKEGIFKKVMTSDIEHNSPFLAIRLRPIFKLFCGVLCSPYLHSYYIMWDLVGWYESVPYSQS